ncbi:MAG: hypothetical protein KDD70_14900, partial [Bdellovibrionales bacterium]|nr:hypothetical protein [Bdellovibrionales bacterium]
MRENALSFAYLAIFAFAVFFGTDSIVCAEELHPILPGMSVEEMEAASVGCKDCHTKTDAPTMHENPGVVIGCADCHGGDPTVRASGVLPESPEYDQLKDKAHVLPEFPEFWPSSANPPNSYTHILKESPEFVRFINPGDLRVAPEACGGCHAQITRAVQKSLMTTSAMLWGGAAYNNNILPYKNYVLGESYGKYGEPQTILHGGELCEERKEHGALEQLTAMPQWEVLSPG